MEYTFKKEISVIVPVYNEADNIQNLLERIHASLTENGYKYEVIFVDDHSTDGTPKIAAFFSKKYPVRVFTKAGKKGKAYSLLEGFEKAAFENLCFIDADLQYPPEAIFEMANLLTDYDVVTANRKNYKEGKVRHLMSNVFKTFFGKALFSLNHDIQAGLKVFKREVYEAIYFKPATSWTFDLEFLHRAKSLGFSVKNFDITFYKRENGFSKIHTISNTFEIAAQALRLRFKKIAPFYIISKEEDTMKNSGIRYKQKKYITHTTLPFAKSSLVTFTFVQKLLLFLFLTLVLLGLFFQPFITLTLIIASLSALYFLDTLFNLYINLKSIYEVQEIHSKTKEIKALPNSKLPVYSILCPLYKEAHIIPQFLHSISKLDWPTSKLDVLLLLEEDDKESIEKVKKMNLPSYVRTVIVPDSQPKTKPKACNYGLAFAKGEYLVIYDAEDKPEKYQLKKAYLAFQKVGKNILCLQSKLNYYNASQNLLTRFFTAEYSLWFDVTLPGFQSIGTTIPLGGTSNHFRTADLKMLQGWDPFNVTEDADLGVRLFKEGYKTAIIDSVTLEEANSKVGNWLRQRSRWIKGYMQTYLVHNRDPYTFVKNKKKHAFLFQLIIGGKIASIIINPFLWIATISYFTLYKYVGPAIESFYPAPVFYMAVFSLVFGNFLYMYYYMIGVMKRREYSVLKYTLLIPVYWVLISMAGFIALYQLFFKPHYWEKTVHGLYTRKNPKSAFSFNIPAIVVTPFRYTMSLIF